MSDIVRLGPGVAFYRNDGPGGNGAANLVVHYSADPERRSPSWPRRESVLYNGGMASIDWRMEQEIDFDAEAGILTYYAFDPNRNLVDAFPIPDEWAKWISVDFGGTVPTCILFLAQNPATMQVVVWGEIYHAQRATQLLKLEVYEFLAEYMRCSVDTLEIDDVLSDGVGDPARRQDIIDWGFDPLPIPLRGNPKHGGYAINARKAGEGRVNDWFTPTFRHCNLWQFVADLQTAGNCRKCGRTMKAEPLLVIQEGKAPNLVRTIPLVVRAEAVVESMESKEEDQKGLENHAPDALRYGCMAWSIDVPQEVSDEQDVLKMHPQRLEGSQLLDRVFAEASARRLRDAEEDKLDAAEVVSSTDPMADLEESMGQLEGLYD